MTAAGAATAGPGFARTSAALADPARQRAVIEAAAEMTRWIIIHSSFGD